MTPTPSNLALFLSPGQLRGWFAAVLFALLLSGCATSPGPDRDDMRPASTWHLNDMKLGRWYLP